MTNQEAIKRLQRSDDYLCRRIEERTAQGLPYHHQEADREAIRFAIHALEHCIALDAWENAQPVRRDEQ